MKPRLSVLCLFLAACCATGRAQSAKPSINIGRHQITLGLPADKTIALLQQDYVVFESDDSKPVNKWFITAGKNTMPIGVVYARSNAVIGIQYVLKGRETDSAQDVFDALFEAAAKVSGEGRNKCVLTTWSGYVAEASLNKAAVSFDCGVYLFELRRIQVAGPDGKTAIGYMVWESLGATD